MPGAFRYLHRWTSITAADVDLLEDRDRELEDYLLENTVKGASTVVTLTAGGAGSVVFPTPFMATPLVVVLCNGDGLANPGSDAQVTSFSATGFSFRTNPALGAVAFRVNWLAMGR